VGSRRDAWCIAFGHHLDSLVEEGFLKEYLEVEQGEPKGQVALRPST